MSVYSLGNMHPMGAYDDAPNYDGTTPPPQPTETPQCPSLPEPNPKTSGVQLQPFGRVDQNLLRSAGRDFQLIEDKYCKYDDQPCPVAVIMANGNVSMMIRLTQIPEAVAKGWTLLGICDQASASIAINKISRAYSASGEKGFVPIYEFFINRGLPKLVKLHMLGQTIGMVYAGFLEKIAHEVSYYSGRANFSKFFLHYFRKVKDGKRYALTYEAEGGGLDNPPMG